MHARATNSIFVHAHVRVGLAFTGVPPYANPLLSEFVGYGRRRA